MQNPGYLFCAMAVIIQLFSQLPAPFPLGGHLLGMVFGITDSLNPSLPIIIRYGNSTTLAVNINRKLRVATAQNRKPKGESFDQRGQANGIFSLLAADYDTLMFIDFRRQIGYVKPRFVGKTNVNIIARRQAGKQFLIIYITIGIIQENIYGRSHLVKSLGKGCHVTHFLAR